VCDEIQEALTSDWQRREFVGLFDHRYYSRRPTILLGNVAVSALGDILGDSVLSRLKEIGMIVECDFDHGWESRR